MAQTTPVLQTLLPRSMNTRSTGHQIRLLGQLMENKCAPRKSQIHGMPLRTDSTTLKLQLVYNFLSGQLVCLPMAKERSTGVVASSIGAASIWPMDTIMPLSQKSRYNATTHQRVP